MPKFVLYKDQEVMGWLFFLVNFIQGCFPDPWEVHSTDINATINQHL